MFCVANFPEKRGLNPINNTPSLEKPPAADPSEGVCEKMALLQGFRDASDHARAGVF